MSLVSAWRLPLRLARRDALRHRGRSALTLVMIMLPVTAVTAADVLAKTQSVSSVESLDRRLGTAAALVTVQAGVATVEQGVDPDGQLATTDGDGDAQMPDAGQVDGLLGGARLAELRTDGASVTTAQGRANVEVLETDLRDPLADGLVDLTSGRLPRTADEVVVNQALAHDGYRIGDRLGVTEDGQGASTLSPTIVGIAESTTGRTYRFAAGPIGSLGAASTADDGWLVGGGAVDWNAVRRLNALGATVLSRAVVEHPPPTAQIPVAVRPTGRTGSDTQVLALVAIMALLEVVLLAGPAFAVGARKQQRNLALMVATGGTPAQSRRVVIASALLLGGLAALLGVGMGIGVARLLQPLLQAHSDTWFGPFDLDWQQLLAIAGFGLLSAFLAAVVPAWISSRQDVVAVLAGRRGDRRPSLRSPVLGGVLLGAGGLGSIAGAGGSGELLIAASAIPSVLGMILLVPLVLAWLGSISGRLPLVLRYAVRDAARHRTRTVPAIAAVAATVAGVVALSIGLSSDQRENRETYTAQLPLGVGMVTSYGADDWDAMTAAVHRYVPGARTTAVQGLPDDLGDGYVDSFLKVPGEQQPVRGGSGTLGATLLASDGRLPTGITGLTAAQRAATSDALGAGRSVVFLTQGESATGHQARLVRVATDDQGVQVNRQAADVAVTFVQPGSGYAGPLAILTSTAVTALHTHAHTVALTVDGADLTKARESDVQQAVAAASDGASFYVERGYQPDPAAQIIEWILIAMGAVLMLGGTLTATFLALSDARADLATLAAVGASPRMRRGVAAAYALVVGLVGAVLGAAVGFIPGLAVVVPLTSQGYDTSGVAGVITDSGPYYDIPWLHLALLVLALPLVAALVVGLFARSRLPLVARLD